MEEREGKEGWRDGKGEHTVVRMEREESWARSERQRRRLRELVVRIYDGGIQEARCTAACPSRDVSPSQ